MIHELDRLAKYYDHVQWKWDDGKTPVKFLWSLEDKLGSRYLIKVKKRSQWEARALECSSLEEHTCRFCGRRGKKGFITEAYMHDLPERVFACIGCRSRYDALRRREHEAEELAKQVRKHLREIRGLINESTKDHAGTA